MPELTVHVTESFQDDILVLRINGVERRRLAGVSTRLLLGYAEVFTAHIDPGVSRVGIELPNRRLAQSLELDVAAGVHLVVRCQEDRLQLSIASEPPAYL